MKIAFISTHNEYDTTRVFEEGMIAACEKRGYKAKRIFFDPYAQREGLLKLMAFNPDRTASFSLFSGKGKGICFSEISNKPHTTFCIASGIYVLHLLKSPLEHVGFVDNRDVKRYHNLFPGQVFFFPHGASGETYPPETIRPIPFLFLGTLFDYTYRKEMLKKRLPASLFDLLEQAEKLLSHTVGYLEALNLLTNETLKASEFVQLHHELEMLYRAKTREAFLHQHLDLPIHIYGKSDSPRKWKDLYQYKSQFVFHEAVNYPKALTLMQQSQYLLHSCPSFAEGVHERVLYGLLAGCAILSDQAPYLFKHFKGKGVIKKPIAEGRRIEEVLLGQQYVKANYSHEALMDYWMASSSLLTS